MFFYLSSLWSGREKKFYLPSPKDGREKIKCFLFALSHLVHRTFVVQWKPFVSNDQQQYTTDEHHLVKTYASASL